MRNRNAPDLQGQITVPPLGLEPRTFGLKDAPLQRISCIYGRLSADHSS
jgi:hypothetical protein